jgi:nucleotide-binding universal stress UspA family protein
VYQQILTPIDGSETSQRAFDAASKRMPRATVGAAQPASKAIKEPS